MHQLLLSTFLLVRLSYELNYLLVHAALNNYSHRGSELSLAGAFPLLICIRVESMTSSIVITQRKSAFLHTNYVPSSIYNEVNKFSNERLSTTIGTVGMPRLAR